MPRLVLTALVAALSVALVALSGAPAGAKPDAAAHVAKKKRLPTRKIDVRDDFFSPRSMKVHKGQKVEFEWVDENDRHNVRATSNARFYSGSRGQVKGSAGPYRITADVGEKVRFICEFHPDSMKGTITVIR